eukprot:TRINITY_DN3804_c0_g1_i3.p2 TRINITY_DN3804_c0_g1~~TRINITY_DN3804_c0_g1_i3.p2  ORF type:complete len:397 (+),score=119.39 TRINITY_DN3804_c0_g1_i3:147-1337(+)
MEEKPLLGVVDSLRASALLDESIEKLSFLAVLGLQGAAAGAAAAGAGAQLGDEISRIIEDQRRLETEYERLIAERGRLKGLANRAKLQATQARIAAVSSELRQSTKILCRNLRDSHNVAENAQRIQEERLRLQDVFAQTRGELRELSFSALSAAVADNDAREASLAELLHNEKAAQQLLQSLREELSDEKSARAVDIQSRTELINKMREDLALLRSQTHVEQRYLKKETRSRADRNNRLFSQKEHELEESILRVRRELKIERRVSKETEAYLRSRIDALERDVQGWLAKWERDPEGVLREIEGVRGARGRAAPALAAKTAAYAAHIAARDARAAADAQLVAERATQAELLHTVNAAATRIQAFFRGCRARQALRKKRKKKGRKGKKKGAKKGAKRR